MAAHAFALGFSVFIVALGVIGLAAPTRMVAIVRRFQTPGGLWFAAALRVGGGLAFWFAAEDSRSPELLRVLAVIVVVAGVALPFAGVDRLRRLVDWWAGQGPVLVRSQALLALTLGGFLVYALLP